MIWAEKQLTKEQAIKFGESKLYEDMTPEQIVDFQFYQKLCCMPFHVFHEAMEKVLGRPVWTHEFAFPEKLHEELKGDKVPPTLEEIMGLIPEEKRIIILTEGQQ